MDSGSAASQFLEDPSGALTALAEAAGVEFPHLMEARSYTERRLEELASDLQDVEIPGSTSVVLFGSSARGELTAHSDDDWGIVTYGSDCSQADVDELAEQCRKILGVDDRKPGRQEIFGVPFSCEELTKEIGLDDTNRNLTRRMLFLLESRAVAGKSMPCWDAVLAEYLSHGTKHHRPPRFLLNDLVRYWRTMCVDFEGKYRGSGGDDPKWVSRNAKLRTSRKVLFAAGLVPVMLCHLKEREQMNAFLTAQLRAFPTDRLAAAFLSQSAEEEGARALTAYDQWVGLLQDGEARAELKRLREDTRDDSPLFAEIRTLGEDLERGLVALLFETDLAPSTRQYAVF